MTTVVPGHTYFSGTYTAPAVKKTSHRHLIVVWVLANNARWFISTRSRAKSLSRR